MTSKNFKQLNSNPSKDSYTTTYQSLYFMRF